MDAARLATEIHTLAAEHGFVRVGFVRAAAVPLDAQRRYRDWLTAGMHGDMSYMQRNVDKRMDVRLLVSQARSVIVLAVSYAHESEQHPAGIDHDSSDRPRPAAIVARYARGRDYHRLLKRRCLSLMDRIRELEPAFEGRAFVDSAPIMERTLAVQAGLGFIGRNGCFIVPGMGSYILLCEIVCNLELPRDAGRHVPPRENSASHEFTQGMTGSPGMPPPADCASCGRCVAACPTGAIGPDGLIDARRCISYLTVEHEGAIAAELASKFDGQVVGCDICQQVCPHNAAVPPGDRELTTPRCTLHGRPLDELAVIDDAEWDAATCGTAARRVSLEMLRRNASSGR